MFFCFDSLNGETVALTCPKKDLSAKLLRCKSNDGFKEFPINGYLYDETSLKDKIQDVTDEKEV